MTTTPETGAGLLESLDRHFLAGCESLSASQMGQHKATGTCPECSETSVSDEENYFAGVTL